MLFVDVLVSCCCFWFLIVDCRVPLLIVGSYNLIVAWFFVIVGRLLSLVGLRFLNVGVGGSLNFDLSVPSSAFPNASNYFMFCPKYKLGNTVTDE
jgi:hypothetical protein